MGCKPLAATLRRMRPWSLAYRGVSQPRSRGQALVELALVSTLLALLMASALDLGRVFYATITVSSAARAGALQAAITPNAFKSQDCSPKAWDPTNAVVCAVEDETANSLVHIAYGQIAITCQDTSSPPKPVSPCPATPTLNERSKVSVTASMPLLTPILQALLGQNVSIGSSAVADQQALPSPVTQ